MKVLHTSTGRGPRVVVKKMLDLPRFIKQIGDETLREMVAGTPVGSIAPNGLLKLAMLNATKDATNNPNDPFYGIGRFGQDVPGSLGDPDKDAPRGTITEFLRWYRGARASQAQTRTANRQARRASRAKKKSQAPPSTIP